MKNLYKNIEDIEEDFKLSNENEAGDPYTREEYYKEALENSDVTMEDEVLLLNWLDQEKLRNFVLIFVNNSFLTEARKKKLEEFGYTIQNGEYKFYTKSHSEFINSLEIVEEDSDLRLLTWVAKTFRTEI